MSRRKNVFYESIGHGEMNVVGTPGRPAELRSFESGITFAAAVECPVGGSIPTAKLEEADDIPRY